MAEYTTATLKVLTMGDPDYETVFGPLREDQDLAHWMMQDAESTLDEKPGKIWWVLVADNGVTAMAWCAATVTTDHDGSELIRCTNSYHRREYRDTELYPLVYSARHAWLVEQGIDAETYVYDQPLPLHLADGWEIETDGVSHEVDEPHRWYGLRWRG